ncbi:Transposase, Rhodopirellula-type, partial [mine drainage metagenome]
DTGLLKALEALLEDATAGDPMSALRWTHKSSRRLAEELTQRGHPVSYDTVIRLLGKLEYSLQVNAKNKEGRSPPERDQQFHHINEQAAL